MKYMKKFTAMLLAALTTVLLCSAALRPTIPLMPQGIKIKRSGSVQGVVINTISSNDFPGAINLSNRELTEEVKKIVEYLHNIGINTIFYEAVNEFQSMYSSRYYPESSFLRTEKNLASGIDPLKLFIQEAQLYDIDIYAVVNPYKVGDSSKVNYLKENYDILGDNTFIYDEDVYLMPSRATSGYIVDMSEELVKKYDVEGVIFDGVYEPALRQLEDMENFLIDQFISVKRNIADIKPEAILGVIFNSDNNNLSDYQKLAASLLENVAVDMVVPRISATSQSGYETKIIKWNNLVSKFSVPMVTINNGYKIYTPESSNDYCPNIFELNYQSIINENMAVSGAVIDDYSSLADKFTGLQNAVSTLFLSDIKTTDYDYKIEPKLKVNFSESGIVYTDKNYFYVTGTSNPDMPVYINDEELENRMPNGIFGVNLPVEGDANMYIFRQGQNYSVIKIYKESEQIDYDKKIRTIVNGTAHPQKSQFVSSEETINVSCIAPGGSTVTATADKMSVVLEQMYDVPEGMPTEFAGEIKISNKYPASTVTDIGKISYAMTFKKRVSVSRSEGNIFVVGKDSMKSIIVDDYIAYVYVEPNPDSDRLYTMKMGARDYVIGETDNYYEIKSGGFISKNSVKLVKGNSKIDASYTSYYTESDQKGESIILKGTSSANIKTKLTDNSVIFTFYNTKVLPDIIPSNTKQFKNIIKMKIGTDTYQLQFIFKDGVQPWGYDYKYIGDNYNDLRIYFKFKPEISDSLTKPLENISVLLDPACVDFEFDNENAIENYGLHESQINLNIALKTKELLESLGATVQITRYDNSYLTTLNRMTDATKANADFFISIGHNHIKNNEDRMDYSGIQVEYSNKSWEDFSRRLSKTMEIATGRKVMEPIENEDIVMQITSCPSVTLKNGYLSNPEEYEDILTPLSSYKTACGIVEAIIATLS